MLTRGEKVPFLLLFFAFFLPPRVSQNWWKFFSNSFASPSCLLPVLSPPLFSSLRLSSWWRSCQLLSTTRQLDNSTIKILLFFLSFSPLLSLLSLQLACDACLLLLSSHWHQLESPSFRPLATCDPLVLWAPSLTPHPSPLQGCLEEFNKRRKRPQATASDWRRSLAL